MIDHKNQYSFIMSSPTIWISYSITNLTHCKVPDVELTHCVSKTNWKQFKAKLVYGLLKALGVYLTL